MKSLFTLFAVLLLSAFALHAQDLQEGLVIHYPFEGNLTDTISGETAENFGNLTFAPGQVGFQAVRFAPIANINNPYFVTPSGALQVGPSEDGGTSGTFAMFVNHSGPSLETDRHNYIAQKNGCGPEDNNRGRVVLYRQNPADDDDADELISFLSGQPQRSEYVLDTADTWVHVALTVDTDTREVVFFIDGTVVGRDTFNGTRNAENSCGEFVIGHHLTFTTETQTFDGLMDDLRFYNRVLTDEEITMLANQFPTSTREEVVRDGITLSPNPATAGQPIRLGLNEAVFRPGSNVELNVIDANGRSVLRRDFTGVAQQLIVEHNLPAGVYAVTLGNGVQLATSKLVVR